MKYSYHLSITNTAGKEKKKNEKKEEILLADFVPKEAVHNRSTVRIKEKTSAVGGGEKEEKPLTSIWINGLG